MIYLRLSSIVAAFVILTSQVLLDYTRLYRDGRTRDHRQTPRRLLWTIGIACDAAPANRRRVGVENSGDILQAVGDLQRRVAQQETQAKTVPTNDPAAVLYRALKGRQIPFGVRVDQTLGSADMALEVGIK